MQRFNSTPTAFGLLVGLGLCATAHAGDLEIRSSGAPVTVVQDNKILGQTPVSLKDLKEGDIVLSFREAPLGATAFSQTFHVAATGLMIWDVDLPGRVVKPATGAAASGGGTPTAASSGATATAGDLYVTSTPAGATVYLDGNPTGQVTPAMLRGLAKGSHHLDVRTECGRASSDVSVATGLITRAELAPTPGTGTLVVTGTPTGAIAFLDGTEKGPLPLRAPDLACGDHNLAVRAPGYLETAKGIHVPAFDTTTVQIDLKKEEYGTLVVDVSPLDASIKVDGLDMGQGPRTLDHVGTGPHHVDANKDGYAQQSQDVQVDANAVARATFNLSKESLVVSQPVLPAQPIMPTQPNVAVASNPAPTNPAVATVTTPKSSHKFPVGRVVLDSAVTLVSLGAGYEALSQYKSASDYYKTYEATADPTDADKIYSDDVQPRETRAVIFGSVAGVAAVGAVVLWVKTDF